MARCWLLLTSFYPLQVVIFGDVRRDTKNKQAKYECSRIRQLLPVSNRILKAVHHVGLSEKTGTCNTNIKNFQSSTKITDSLQYTWVIKQSVFTPYSIQDNTKWQLTIHYGCKNCYEYLTQNTSDLCRNILLSPILTLILTCSQKWQNIRKTEQEKTTMKIKKQLVPSMEVIKYLTTQMPVYSRAQYSAMKSLFLRHVTHTYIWRWSCKQSFSSNTSKTVEVVSSTWDKSTIPWLLYTPAQTCGCLHVSLVTQPPYVGNTSWQISNSIPLLSEVIHQ